MLSPVRGMLSGVPVAGADVAAGRWVGVLLDDAGRFAGACAAAEMSELLEEMRAAAARLGGPLRTVAVDIPIGLPVSGARAADVEAKAVLGPRSASLFITPTRAALSAPTFAEALVRNRARTGGVGLSKQAYALRDMIFDVERCLDAGPGLTVVEVHPEVSFRQMTGAPMRHRKRSWSGAVERRSALARQGVAVPDDIGPAGAQAAVDDVLDAAAAAWTARRYPDAAVPFPHGGFEGGGPVIWA